VREPRTHSKFYISFQVSNRYKMSSATTTTTTATAYRVPAIVEWDDFMDAMRANGGRGFAYGAPAPTATVATCGVVGCTGPCAATVASRHTAPTPTPTPTPAPVVSTAPAPATPSPAEQLLFNAIAVSYYGLRRSALDRASYEDYKRWEATRPADYIRSTTPYARITQYITVERIDWLEWNCIPGIEYDKIRLLGKMFPARSLMEMKDIIFPLYLEWRKTAIFLPKMNRWQKMKQFSTEYAGLL
jgi:hypothetical protein